MKIVYLIGNGFDLNLGLKTKYNDFFNDYAKRRGESNNFVKAVRKAQMDGDKDWSDLELFFGEYTNEHSTYDGLFSSWSDIQLQLAKYVKSQQKNLYIKPNNIPEQDKQKSLHSPESFLDEAQYSKIALFLNKYINHRRQIDIINFNYTTTLEKIYGWSGKSRSLGKGDIGQEYVLNSITHIHGTTEHNLIFGVDNKQQIKNPTLRDNTEVHDWLIKTISNSHINLNVNKCASLITNADLICVFGMSYGKTDMMWWKKIVSHLRAADSRLIMFARGDAVDPVQGFLIGKQIRKKQEQFLDAAECKEREQVRNKIIVGFNTGIFDTLKPAVSKAPHSI